MALGLMTSPDRLFAAADALLQAIDSPWGLDTCIAVYVGPPRPISSPPTKDFTHDELLEAMDMLLRMGYVLPSDQNSTPASGGNDQRLITNRARQSGRSNHRA